MADFNVRQKGLEARALFGYTPIRGVSHELRRVFEFEVDYRFPIERLSATLKRSPNSKDKLLVYIFAREFEDQSSVTIYGVGEKLKEVKGAIHSLGDKLRLNPTDMRYVPLSIKENVDETLHKLLSQYKELSGKGDEIQVVGFAALQSEREIKQ